MARPGVRCRVTVPARPPTTPLGAAMAQQFVGLAAKRPDAVALADERHAVTWAQLDERVNRFVNAARQHGLTGGQRVAVLSGNRVEAVEIMAACMHAGLTIVPINWHATADEVAYVLGDCEADALVLDGAYRDLVDPASPVVAGYRLRVLLADDGRAAGFTEYEALLAGSSPAEPAEQRGGGLMFYTSGTTGAPKGALSDIAGVDQPVDHVAYLSGLVNAVLRIGEDARVLLSGPLYHSAQLVFGLCPLLTGRELVIRHGLDAEGLLRVIDAERITNVSLVPTHFVRLLRLPQALRQAFDGSSLVSVVHGGAPCPPVTKRAMIEWWGPKLLEYYGASEAGFASICDSETWLSRPGTVGRVLPTMELLVVRDDGTIAGAGETGLLYFRSRLGRDFVYHNDPEKTAAAHREPGVFTFGDVGRVDEDGFLFLSDRKADLIISGGVNIYPAEVEHVLIGHPAVADAAVFGIPDPEYGERVHATLQLTAGTDPTPTLAEAIKTFARERLAAYKLPRSIEFVPHLPRTPTGKLKKRLLRDTHWAAAGRNI
jgi:long-chain acyl-CoA synthetase